MSGNLVANEQVRLGGGRQLQAEAIRANLNGVPFSEGDADARANARAVEEGTVPAIEIFEEVAAVGLDNLGVVAADGGGDETDGRVRLTAEHGDRPLWRVGQFVLAAYVRALQRDEGGHTPCCTADHRRTPAINWSADESG